MYVWKRAYNNDMWHMFIKTVIMLKNISLIEKVFHILYFTKLHVALYEQKHVNM